MVNGILGKKIGMTQVFEHDKVVPVTVVDVDNFLVVGLRDKKRDGYDAICVGRLRARYNFSNFSEKWLKDLKRYFSHIREIKVEVPIEGMRAGTLIDFSSYIQKGDTVDVSGRSIGRGFAGVVKRHGFAGPPASHGSTMGKRPGSIGSFCSQGKVIKGKKLPGHMGYRNCMVRGLDVVRVEPERKVLLIKGSVPGKSGTMLFMRKA